jgi:rhodanese-related sulfurtransferase
MWRAAASSALVHQRKAIAAPSSVMLWNHTVVSKRYGSSAKSQEELLQKNKAFADATRQDSNAMPASEKSTSGEEPSTSHAVTASAPTGLTNGFDSQGSSRDWTEPTLTDLDRSIPQVDCKFIADLIRTRTARRREFLAEQSTIKEKLVNVVKDRNISESEDAERALIKELTDDEKQILLHTRPEYNDGFVIIDCRTVNEVTSWGIIEGAKVLPGHEMFEAFHMTPEDFELEFGFPKPKPDETVIFYCQYGPRSLMAAQILSWLGYENVLHFRDGYHEWSKQYNLLVRRWMEHDKTSGNNVKRLVAFEASRQLQREIAPEFNALPLQEMERYMLDETRSPGVMKIGENTRTNALKRLAGIVGEDKALVSGGGDAAIPGTVEQGSGTGQGKVLLDFMSEVTGVKADAMTSTSEAGSMSLGDAQHRVSNDLRDHSRIGGGPQR